MPIIDPDGMFGGDRIARLSDRGKALWPWFFLASNGFGRLEINYRRLLARVFSSFQQPPTEVEALDLIREYNEAFLLFIYASNGQLWGQWWTSEKYLPRHKTTADSKSPQPPNDAYIGWQNEYGTRKNTQVPVIPTFSENVQKLSEGLCANLRVVVGGVVGVENICASSDAPVCAPATNAVNLRPPNSNGMLSGKTERERWFNEQFWPIVWAKIGRGAAKKAWMAKVTTESLREKAIKAAIEQGPSIIQRAQNTGSSVLHPATWINAERWDDEPEVRFQKQKWQDCRPSQAEIVPRYIPPPDMSHD